jgi:hypothetical protein
VAGLAFAGAFVCSPASAHADDAKADARRVCTEAYSAAQTLRDAHRLIVARDSLRVCAQSRCSAFIAKDCAAWLVDTEARIPHVVLAATEGGVSTQDVVVTMDGEPLAGKLDGRAIDVDPGQHTFVFTSKGGAKVERQVVVREGNGVQEVAATFEAPAAVTPAPVPASVTPAALTPAPVSAAPVTPATGDHVDGAPAPHVDHPFWTRRRVLGASVGGGGAAVVVLGSVFGGLAISQSHTQNADCQSPQNCTNRQGAANAHSAAQVDGAVSTVAFVVGGALIAGGAVIFLSGGGDDASGDRPSVALVPSLVRDGAGLHLQGTF